MPNTSISLQPQSVLMDRVHGIDEDTKPLQCL